MMQPVMQPGYGYGAPPPSMRQEQTFLVDNGVQVTSTRFVVGGHMYPINGITSVAPFTLKAKRVLLALVGTLALLFALPALFTGSFGAFLVPGIVAGLCIWRAIARKDVHYVMIHTAGGQIRALSSQNALHVQQVIGALHHAIAYRG